MRYKIGEKVSLKDNLKHGDTNLFVTYVDEMSYMKKTLNKITRVEGIDYVVDDEKGLWLINDYMIDHEKTIELLKSEDEDADKNKAF